MALSAAPPTIFRLVSDFWAHLLSEEEDRGPELLQDWRSDDNTRPSETFTIVTIACVVIALVGLLARGLQNANSAYVGSPRTKKRLHNLSWLGNDATGASSVRGAGDDDKVSSDVTPPRRASAPAPISPGSSNLRDFNNWQLYVSGVRPEDDPALAPSCVAYGLSTSRASVCSYLWAPPGARYATDAETAAARAAVARASFASAASLAAACASASAAAAPVGPAPQSNSSVAAPAPAPVPEPPQLPFPPLVSRGAPFRGCLLFLPDPGSHARRAAALLRPLASHGYACVAVDLPGFGRSAKRDAAVPIMASGARTPLAFAPYGEFGAAHWATSAAVDANAANASRDSSSSSSSSSSASARVCIALSDAADIFTACAAWSACLSAGCAPAVPAQTPLFIAAEAASAPLAIALAGMFPGAVDGVCLLSPLLYPLLPAPIPSLTPQTYPRPDSAAAAAAAAIAAAGDTLAGAELPERALFFGPAEARALNRFVGERAHRDDWCCGWYSPPHLLLPLEASPLPQRHWGVSRATFEAIAAAVELAAGKYSALQCPYFIAVGSGGPWRPSAVAPALLELSHPRNAPAWAPGLRVFREFAGWIDLVQDPLVEEIETSVVAWLETACLWATTRRSLL